MSPRAHAVPGSTARPTAAVLDLLGRRWALRVVWELADQPVGFRALQARCDNMSSSVLRDRLADLVEAEIVGTDDAGRYGLTVHGAELVELLDPLSSWAERWARRMRRR